MHTPRIGRAHPCTVLCCAHAHLCAVLYWVHAYLCTVPYWVHAHLCTVLNSAVAHHACPGVCPAHAWPTLHARVLCA
eukprot:1465124-Rhodomonas_salina.3